jgi:hypothetical protein
MHFEPQGGKIFEGTMTFASDYFVLAELKMFTAPSTWAVGEGSCIFTPAASGKWSS